MADREPSQDTTRDWSGEEAEALAAERDRERELIKRQLEKE